MPPVDFHVVGPTPEVYNFPSGGPTRILNVVNADYHSHGHIVSTLFFRAAPPQRDTHTHTPRERERKIERERETDRATDGHTCAGLSKFSSTRIADFIAILSATTMLTRSAIIELNELIWVSKKRKQYI